MRQDRLRPPLGSAYLRIREAQSSDIDDLVRLEMKAFASDRLSRRRLRAHTRSPTAGLLVARRGGKIAGYALVLIRRGSHAARLHSLAVEPDAARQGIGSRLLAAAEAAALARGATNLRLEVRTDNAAAIRLYERAGYRMIGRRDGYYEDGAAALRYERDLGGAGMRRLAAGRLRRAA
jgi:[ribosomal protein S18]-alanine N-acetyltransferase